MYTNLFDLYVFCGYLYMNSKPFILKNYDNFCHNDHPDFITVHHNGHYILCINIRKTSGILEAKKTEANAEVPKAAVPGAACWEWLQKRVSSHKTACKNAQLYNKDNHQIIQSLVLKWFWS